METIDKKAIEEINTHISDALSDWASILLKANADEWEYYLYIFSAVWQNNAIKRGVLNDENAVYRIKKFQKALEVCFEINTLALDK